MKPKIGNKLAALMADDEPIGTPVSKIKSRFDGVDLGSGKVIKPKVGAKLAALMDDDEDMPPTKAAEPVKATPRPQKQPPARPQREPSKLDSISIVHCGESPVLIITGLSATWSDLLCYNYEAQAVMHLKREDLSPAAAVDETISSLRKHINISPSTRK